MVSKEGLKRGLGLIGLAFLLDKLEENPVVQGDGGVVVLGQEAPPQQPIVNVSQEFMKEIPPYGLPISSIETRPYQAYISHYNKGLVVIVGNYQIGSAFDSPAFKASIDKLGKFMTDPQLEVALALEDIVRETRKHLGPRTNSGRDAHAHIVMNSDISLENAIAANVRPDYVAHLLTIAIDLVEDHSHVLELYKGWEDALVRHNEPRTIQIERELTEYRIKILNDAQNVLTKLVDRMGIPNSEKARLKEDVYDIIKLTGHVTRHPEERPYPLSMAFQFDKRGNESPAIVLARMGAKIWDRTSNNLDTGPIMTYEEFQEAQRALRDGSVIGDYTVGQYLGEKYGDVKFGKYMPPAVRTGNAVNNLSILHPLNKTLDQIEEKVRPSTREAELLRWIEYSEFRMIQSALGLATSANDWYELVLPRQVIEAVDERVELKKNSNFYNAVTPDGFFMDWLGYDIAGRKFIEFFDASPEKRTETYGVSRDLAEVLPMFGMFSKKGHRDDYGRPVLITDPQVKFNSRIHERFTLDGMDDRLKELQGDDYRNMARRWLPYKLERNGNGKNGAVQLPLL